MEKGTESDILLDIPNLNWPSWETLVSAALDGIAGVSHYEVNALRREARVFFDPSQIGKDQLMDQLKKKTRYRSMSIKSWRCGAAPLKKADAAGRGGYRGGAGSANGTIHPTKETGMEKFVYTLSRNDVNLAARCFQFAKIAHEKGHQVHLFFIEDGTLWADRRRDFKEKTVTGDCPQDYFPYLEENEIPIGVWPPCAKARQVDEANFYSNMMLDGAPHLIDLMAEGKVFNF